MRHGLGADTAVTNRVSHVSSSKRFPPFFGPAWTRIIGIDPG